MNIWVSAFLSARRWLAASLTSAFFVGVTGTQAEAVAFLQAVHTKLGGFKSAEPGQWRVNSTPGGTFVDLNYSSQFELGSGVESFTFLRSGNQRVCSLTTLTLES